MADVATRNDVWHNWAGNQEARPARVARPATPAEVSDLVGRAVTAGQRVKPIGAGHSFTAIGLTDGIQLDLRLLAGLVAVDRESGLVTVEAGMPLHRLNAVLEQAGLSLSNLGDIDRQTVAGAISTGTHGTGKHLGGIATQIRALELVVGDGTVVRCSATEEPELFEAARVGLGALGVITKVTLQAEPRFVLTAQERPMALGAVLEHLDELVEENEHFEFFWFPHTDKTLTKRNNRLPADQPARPLGPVRRFVEDELVSNGAFELTCLAGRVRPSLIPRINGFAARLMGDREYADVSHRVFTSPRRVRFVEMEYAVPRAAVAEALAGIERVIAEHDLKVSFPVEVRFTAADDIPLSTASGRDSAYLAIHMFKGQPYETYFHAVEDLMNTLEGRPHWGKMHYQTAAALRPRYPRFADFLAVREKVDPDGVFANDYLDRVLGPVPVAESPTEIGQLRTPALLVEADLFQQNLDTMAAALPGARMRPHVKAHKTTALARRQREAGHPGFTCATIREAEGLVAAGLGEDVLLANEILDARRIGDLVASGARVTVAVDSPETVKAAVNGGVREVVVDVNVGLPRCGCRPEDAGRLADLARADGLTVRGVMGYEGHLMMVQPLEEQKRLVGDAMGILLAAAEDVGESLVSAGGTGTYALNTWANEIQAGSYALMDTSYGSLDLPFVQALSVLGTVISSNDGWSVVDVGLKSLGMDHGNPSIPDAEVWFCSDEHTTFKPAEPLAVGTRIRVIPAHVDPTVALHEAMWLVEGETVRERWAVDLRGW